MHVIQNNFTGFIYGVPPRAKEVYDLDVVATNRDTFETGLLRLIVNVTSAGADNTVGRYNIRLKIDNLNLEDMFDTQRLKASNIRTLERSTEKTSDFKLPASFDKQKQTRERK